MKDYVGELKEPKDGNVTVEMIIDVVADEFPELVLALAEENWINGYTQALSDMDFMLQKQRATAKSEKQKIDNN